MKRALMLVALVTGAVALGVACGVGSGSEARAPSRCVVGQSPVGACTM